MNRRRFLPSYHYEDNTDGVLSESVGKPLRDYKIYGNSKQNSIPAPDAPAEIESVGDKSVNLLPFPYEIKSSSTTNGVTYTINDDRSITVSGTATGYSDFCFLWQTQITELGGTVGDTLYFSLNATDLKNIVGVININIGGTITSPTFTTSYKLEITEDNVNALITFSIKSNNNVATSGVICPMISKKATDYEPYGYYKVPIKVNGLAHNIYLSEPLRKVGEYADYIDFKNRCIVRNTQEVVCLSNKAYLYTYSGMNGARFDSTLQEGGQRYTGFCTHSDKVYFKNQQGEVWCGANGNTSVYWIGILDLLGLSTIGEFKAWLDAQEIPVEVVCGRNTPINEPIELPDIPTAKGTTNITVGTDVEPSTTTWQYYRK